MSHPTISGAEIRVISRWAEGADFHKSQVRMLLLSANSRIYLVFFIIKLRMRTEEGTSGEFDYDVEAAVRHIPLQPVQPFRGTTRGQVKAF